jgi:hypothetical protein
MSTTSTFLLGLGGGAALWYLTKRKHSSAPRATATPAPAPRNCAVQIQPSGITVDGHRTELGDAVRRCATADRADVIVSPDASASTCAAFVAALDTANVPVRNARRRKPTRQSGELTSTFTLVVFPDGIWGTKKRVRYFKATPPTTWEDARDRLAAAKFLDRNALSPNLAGAWRLVTDPARFREDRAESLPGKPDRPRAARHGAR